MDINDINLVTWWARRCTDNPDLPVLTRNDMIDALKKAKIKFTPKHGQLIANNSNDQIEIAFTDKFSFDYSGTFNKNEAISLTARRKAFLNQTFFEFIDTFDPKDPLYDISGCTQSLWPVMQLFISDRLDKRRDARKAENALLRSRGLDPLDIDDIGILSLDDIKKLLAPKNLGVSPFKTLKVLANPQPVLSQSSQSSHSLLPPSKITLNLPPSTDVYTEVCLFSLWTDVFYQAKSGTNKKLSYTQVISNYENALSDALLTDDEYVRVIFRVNEIIAISGDERKDRSILNLVTKRYPKLDTLKRNNKNLDKTELLKPDMYISRLWIRSHLVKETDRGYSVKNVYAQYVGELFSFKKIHPLQSSFSMFQTALERENLDPNKDLIVTRNSPELVTLDISQFECDNFISSL